MTLEAEPYHAQPPYIYGSDWEQWNFLLGVLYKRQTWMQLFETAGKAHNPVRVIFVPPWNMAFHKLSKELKM